MKNILEKHSTEICKDILNIIDNKEVKIEIEEKNKSSLYVFLNNTIYISDKFNKNKDNEKNKKAKLLVIAHECAHSIQSKTIQILNFILSNIELIMFFIIVVWRIFGKGLEIISYGYFVVALISIFIRFYLELNATVNSIKIVARYLLSNKINRKEVKSIVSYYKKELFKTTPLFVLSLYLFKFIRIGIIILI